MSDLKFFTLVILTFAMLMFAMQQCIRSEWRECEDNGNTYNQGECQ